MNFLKHIGDKVRTQILRSGYSSIELYAHENDIPKSTLSEIITGKNDPRLGTLVKICAGLNITLADFFRDPLLDEYIREKAPKYIPSRSSAGAKRPPKGGSKKT